MPVVLTEERQKEKLRHWHGGEQGGRHWSDAATSWGSPGVSRSWKEAKKDFLLWTCWSSLDFGLWPPEPINCFRFKPPSGCYDSPRKLLHSPCQYLIHYIFHLFSVILPIFLHRIQTPIGTRVSFGGNGHIPSTVKLMCSHTRHSRSIYLMSK